MIDVYRRKWTYFLGVPIWYTLEFYKTVKDIDRAKKLKKNKNRKFVI